MLDTVLAVLWFTFLITGLIWFVGLAGAFFIVLITLALVALVIRLEEGPGK